MYCWRPFTFWLCSVAAAACTALADDPYRSLAALVRKAGGYQKSSKPFSEVGLVWRPQQAGGILQQGQVHKGSAHSHLQHRRV
jgi:hypothetical protein